MNDAFFETVALWSEVAGAVAFLVVLVLLFRRFLIPAVQANQEARNAEIVDAEARRDRLRAEAEHARDEIAQAERDAQSIEERAGADASIECDHLLAEVQAEGERLLRNAGGELQRARFIARNQLRIELIERALVKARAEAPARIDAATDERLVDETVETLARGAG